MNHIKTSFSLIIFLLLSLWTISAQPVPKDTLKNYKLDEVIIQSPKYNRPLFDIPASASMIPERMIETGRIENLTDVSSVIPNFFMPDYGSKLTSPVYIRGVGNRINTPSVGLYVDEIPYFEKAAFNFDFYDIERIEVLRGPQGTLYGRNAMGGLIHVTTNRPGREQKTTLSVDYGNFNQVRTNITHTQPLGKSWSVLGSLNQRHNNGFYENMHTGSEVDRLNSYSGKLKVHFNPSKKFQALGNLQYEDSRQGGYPYALFNVDENRAGKISYDKESIYNRKLLSGGLNLTYAMPSLTLRAVSSLQTLDDQQEIDQDFTPQDMYFVTQLQQMQMAAQEITLESDKGQTYSWLLGMFGFHQMMDKSVTLHYGEVLLAKMNNTTAYWYTKTYDHINSGAALFHQSTLNLGALTLTAGFRFDYEKATMDYADDRYINGSGPNRNEAFSSSMDFQEILPKVALQYHINSHLVPYATVAKGYNPGGFNSTFEREEDRSFDPEHSWNYEAGLKGKWLQQRIYANVALFFIDWSNQQIYQAVPSGNGSMLTNAGVSESKGFEVEVKALPLQNLETWVTFGYNEATFIDYKKNENEDYSGNYLPYVPRLSFNTGGNYQFSVRWPWIDRVRLHLSYQGFGKHYWHESNTAYQPFYGLLNHRISLEKRNISLSFWSKNLLNTTYNSFYFQALNNAYVQVGKPTTLGVMLKVTF